MSIQLFGLQTSVFPRMSGATFPIFSKIHRASQDKNFIMMKLSQLHHDEVDSRGLHYLSYVPKSPFGKNASGRRILLLGFVLAFSSPNLIELGY